jgi:hypothetical protein
MQQVIRCPNCGSPNYSDQKFCGACGASLITGCPNCGSSIDPGAKFCGNCGAQLSGGAPPPPQQPGWGQQPGGMPPPPQQSGWGQQPGGMPQQQQMGWGQPPMRRTSSSSTSTFLIVVLVVLIASLGTFGYFAFFSDSPPWSGIGGGGGAIEVTSGPFITVTDNTSSEIAVEWETDVLCKGQVEYGETTEYGSTSDKESSFVKSHSVSLPDMDPGTSYNYRLLLEDKKGNKTTSTNNTFTSPQT